MAAQLPDRILYNGMYMDLFSNPLEIYWLKYRKTRPLFYPLEDCKRGYLATWEIRNNQLYLKDVDGNFEKKSLFFKTRAARFTLEDLFPRMSHKLVKAEWFTGKLRIPLGKMLQYANMGYNSRFEKEVIITVDKGDIVKVVTIDHRLRNLVVNSDIIKRRVRRSGT